MAGIHGKNATLRVSTSESVLSGVLMGTSDDGGSPNQGQQFWVPNDSQRNWKYDRDRTLITFSTGVEQGGDKVTDRIGVQTRLINYAFGAIELGPYPAVVSGVFAQAVAMTLTSIGNLIGDARSFTLAVNSDTVDTTTMGESWKSFADGLAGFEGSLDGLYIDDFWYRQAVATLSGVIPQRVLRLAPNPADQDTYFQGTVIFPSWEITGGFDAAIEHTVPFQGRGPLDLVQNTADGQRPFFNLSEVF